MTAFRDRYDRHLDAALHGVVFKFWAGHEALGEEAVVSRGFIDREKASPLR